jgi:hypothetical protein
MQTTKTSRLPNYGEMHRTRSFHSVGSASPSIASIHHETLKQEKFPERTKRTRRHTVQQQIIQATFGLVIQVTAVSATRDDMGAIEGAAHLIMSLSISRTCGFSAKA